MNEDTLLKCPCCGACDPVSDWNKNTQAHFNYKPIALISEDDDYYGSEFMCPSCGELVTGEELEVIG